MALDGDWQVKHNGTWSSIQEAWVNNNGTWERFIRTQPVDGDWSAWSGYSTCTASCGGGTYSRTRVCNNPTPAYGGADCSGSTSETTACNTQSCCTAGSQTFTSSGTFNMPSGCTSASVTVVAAGGGGGGGEGNGGGGGGGGTWSGSITGSVSVTVGSGGTGGLGDCNYGGNYNATNGGASSFGSYISRSGGTAGTNICSGCGGGTGGAGGSDSPCNYGSGCGSTGGGSWNGPS